MKKNKKQKNWFPWKSGKLFYGKKREHQDAGIKVVPGMLNITLLQGCSLNEKSLNCKYWICALFIYMVYVKKWRKDKNELCCCCYVASVVSDSVRRHRRQPTRPRRPWDSLGKNTGVGCHFLLQCRKVKSESEVAHSCATLRDPMNYTVLLMLLWLNVASNFIF